MEHFISIIYSGSTDKQKIAECLATSNTSLNENELEFVTARIGNQNLIRMSLSEAVNDVDKAAESLAMKLFDLGLQDFDIEITEATSGTLRRGMRGEEVKKLQQQLGITADGIFGPATERAVRQFQQNAGIQVDGIVGQQTQSAILQKARPDLGIKTVEPGAGYIDAPYPDQPAGSSNIERPRDNNPRSGDTSQAPIDGGIDVGTTKGGPSRLRQRQQQQQQQQDKRYYTQVDDPELTTGPQNGRGGPRGQGGAQIDRRIYGLSNPNTNTTAPDVMTTPPTMSAPADDNAPGIGAQSIPVTGYRPDDPAVNRRTPAAPQFGGGERDIEVDTNPPSKVAPNIDTDVANAMAGTFYQAMKGGTGIGTNKPQIQRQLQNMSTADMFNATAEAYEREHGVSLFQHFYDEMSDRHINRYVKPELDRLGITMPGREKFESVAPRPKGAFMFRERNEWIAQYGKTHNTDGSLKTNYITESISALEETYEGDDFHNTYGILWYNEDEELDEAEYQGRKVKLGKPMRGDVKKFKVYVKNPKGNVVKVNFGDPNMRIKKSSPGRRKSFRARHNCDNPGPRHKARYWSCRKW